MKIILVEPSKWNRIKDRILRFIRRNGDGRITHNAIRWLMELKEENLQEEGTLILVAVEEKRILGVLAIAHYGIEQSVVVVRREARQRGIGTELTRQLMEHVDKVYGRVALDNIPSLNMCFAMGMVAFKLFEGPTGKPTLWLGLGNWKKEDVE